MDWTTLISVVIGGLIATVPILINNRFQAKERDKDRDEQRMEARTRVREKWIERDILKIMDSVEKILTLHSEDRILERRLDALQKEAERGLFTKTELAVELKSHYERFISLESESRQASDTISRLVHSFDEVEIISSYKAFIDATMIYLRQEREYHEKKIRGESDGVNTRDNWIVLREKAGRFHNALREKMISIRDSEK